MKRTRIFIADDHELLRAGVRRFIESREEWEVCGEAADGRDVANAVREAAADIVILDVAMPGMSGIEIAGQIKRENPQIELLIFSGDDAAATIQAAFKAGASSYIRKGEDRGQLIAAIEELARHKPYLTPDVSKVLLGAFTNSAPTTDRLSPREREIVRLLCEGKSNQQVAALLDISPRTAEVHRAAVMRKLELDTFAELVRYAVRNGIVDP
jgi:DNA-binding NarL/FixJ family response regulator